MPFAAVINVATLSGSDGFRIAGIDGYDSTARSVAGAGDINGDGVMDIIIGAPYAETLDSVHANSGGAYVIFGRAAGGFAANIPLSTLNGANGFNLLSVGTVFSYLPTGPELGASVAGVGDINGDGIDDLVAGAPGISLPVNRNGGVFATFGHTGPFPANVWAGGTNFGGLDFLGNAAFGSAGYSVAPAGDFNGDGVNDVIIGTPKLGAGLVYVLFGGAWMNSNPNQLWVTAGAVIGPHGVVIRGVADNDLFGQTVSSAGDVNGDGFDDLIVGSHSVDTPALYSGAAYVIFGSAAPATDFNVANLDGTNGFRLGGMATQSFLGRAVAGVGDINGDGLDDVAVSGYGAGLSTSYVVYGRRSGFQADLDPSTVNGANGFAITGTQSAALSRAGDINGDGLADMIIGGRPFDHPTSSYVLFGREGGFGASVDVSTFDGSTGIRIDGPQGTGMSAAALGDVNGDGIDDIILGNRLETGNRGAAYVIFGVSDFVNFMGTAIDDVARGGGQGDILRGGGGKDLLRGLGGPDQMFGDAGNDQLYGGLANDLLDGGIGNDLMDGGEASDILIGQTGADKLFGGDGGDTLNGGDDNDRLEGGAGPDTLQGGADNDLLDGGAGNDTATGGLGNDVYIIDALGDVITEEADEGYDIVRTDSVDGWTLGANFEGLQLLGTADLDGTGNGLANNIQGNAGKNTLDGGIGVDTIDGGDGDDIVIGGLGNDLLRGGGGADSFRVAHAFGGVLETDQVFDFSAAEGDVIDLSGAFAGTIALVTAFSRVAGQMTLTHAGGITSLKLDTTGDGKADYQMKINGDVTAESGDWLL